MSPHHFAKLYKKGYRQSNTEKIFEEKVEHAISFAFSPAVFHPIKTVTRLRRFLVRGSQSKQ
jgi:hypothetical protein